MSNESSSRPLGGGVLVSVHHRTVYVSTALWLVNHLVRFVVSTPETKASHHQLLGCPWLQSQLAWKKERKREYPLHPCLPTPIHSSRPSSLHYKPVEQINIFYKNSNGSQKKKNGLKAYNAYLVGRSNSPILLHSDIRTGLSRR